MEILVLGGNRFFGKKLTGRLLDQGHRVTLLNRGSRDDGFGGRIHRIQCDRNDKNALQTALKNKIWDLVYDQVCFDFETAKTACEVFSGCAQRYIFTSSQSVYEPGKSLSESNFLPHQHDFSKKETKDSHYAEAKRQAEAGFAQFAKFPVVYARLPIVIGEDDYTGRFYFHLDRIQNQRPLFFPNREAQISFISSDLAAQALAALGETPLDGAINIASPKPISLAGFIQILEAGLNKKAIYTETAHKDNHSPYGIEEDWFMDCGKLGGLGLGIAEIQQWLPAVVTTSQNS